MYTDLYISYSENDDYDNRVTNLISVLRKQLKRETGYDFFASKDYQEKYSNKRVDALQDMGD